MADAEEELLTAQPQGLRDGATLDAAARRDLAALERGVKMRTLYQHSARRSSITQKYVAAVTARGAEVRTLDEFFNRIIVIDRRMAVIPGASGPATALLIREPNLLAYLVDIFERTWERARPFTNRGSAAQRDIAHEQRQMTIRMLIEGHADPASAKRLGVSPRTYAGYIADLKEEFEAETRFQLGYKMGQHGMSGNERAEPDDRDNEGSASGAALVHETGRGVGLRSPAMGGRPAFPSQACGVVGTSADRVAVSDLGSYLLLLRQPGQSQPVSAAFAGELTPASPIVIAAVATRIAALRRKVIKCLPWCGVPGWSHPPNLQCVGAEGLPSAHSWLI